MQQRPRGRADRRRRHVGGAAGPRDEHGGAGRLGRTRCGAEVLRIRDAVEDDDERLLRERERAEVTLPQLARALGVVAQSRDDALVIGRQTIELGPVRLVHVDPGGGRRVGDRTQSLGLTDAGSDEHVRHASGADGLDDRASSPDGRRIRHRSVARARHPTPSPESPKPSGRVALTDTRSSGTSKTRASAARISSAARGDRGTFAEDGHVARPGRVPGIDDQRNSARQELQPADPFDGGVGVGEVIPDVAHGRGPEEGVGDRVTDRVAVGVPDEAGLAFEPYAAEPELA